MSTVLAFPLVEDIAIIHSLRSDKRSAFPSVSKVSNFRTAKIPPLSLEKVKLISPGRSCAIPIDLAQDQIRSLSHFSPHAILRDLTIPKSDDEMKIDIETY